MATLPRGRGDKIDLLFSRFLTSLGD